MSLILFQSAGGFLVLPDRASLLVSRENGGNLVINPPRPVWERSELTRVRAHGSSRSWSPPPGAR